MPTAPRADEVHLWRAPLDVAPQVATRFAQLLSHDERDRAGRLRGTTDRARYVAAHGWTRQLVGACIGAAPASLVFTPEEHGKLALTAPSVPWLRFNLSHSGSIVVFAVARGRDVGVDVELIRDGVDFEGVARRLFTKRQRTELAQLPAADRALAFYAMWTRNEAYVKATGTGLAAAGGFPDDPPGWLLAEFATEPGYVATVAVQGDAVTVPAAAAELS